MATKPKTKVGKHAKEPDSIDRLHEKYYGAGSKAAKRKAKEQKLKDAVKARQAADKEPSQPANVPERIAEPTISNTRKALMLEAKNKGVKYFRILSRQELATVLSPATAPDQIEAITSAAIARWKGGWGTGAKHQVKKIAEQA